MPGTQCFVGVGDGDEGAGDGGLGDAGAWVGAGLPADWVVDRVVDVGGKTLGGVV